MNIKGETLSQKIDSIKRIGFISNNTDLEAAFDKTLSIAVKNNIPQEEMPKAIVVVSDMEIDSCGNRQWTFYEKMVAKFANHGYQIPNIIFWNVNSRHDVFHADKSRRGVYSKVYNGSELRNYLSLGVRYFRLSYRVCLSA